MPETSQINRVNSRGQKPGQGHAGHMSSLWQFLALLLILFYVFPCYRCITSSSNQVHTLKPDDENPWSFHNNRYQWNVAIGSITGFNFTFICSGTLITNDAVLTSASCFQQTTVMPSESPGGSLKPISNIFVLDGTLELFNIKAVIQHPNFEYGSFYNDLVILKLDRPMDIRSGVNVGRYIPDSSYETWDISSKFSAIVSEWEIHDELKSHNPMARFINRPWVSNEFYRMQQTDFERVPSVTQAQILKTNVECESRYMSYFSKKKWNYHQNFPKGIDGSLMCVTMGETPYFQENTAYQLLVSPLTPDSKTTTIQNAKYWLAGTRAQPKLSSEILADSNYAQFRNRFLPGIYTNVLYFMPWIEKILAEMGKY